MATNWTAVMEASPFGFAFGRRCQLCGTIGRLCPFSGHKSVLFDDNRNIAKQAENYLLIIKSTQFVCAYVCARLKTGPTL
jgi:hypothetical protein